MLGIGLDLTNIAIGRPEAGAPPAGPVDLGWATVADGIGGGTDQSGVSYVVIPSGSATITLAEAQRVDGGDALDGAQIDPQRLGNGYFGTHAYDQRIPDAYDGSLAVTFPATISAGQIVVKARSQLPRAGTDGYIAGYDVLHVVTRAPGATEILPAAVGWTGRGTPAPLPFDAAARLAELPVWDATGTTFPDFATLMAVLDPHPAVFAQNTGTAAVGGYETLVPEGASGVSGSGYARYIGQVQAAALFALTADPSPYSAAERLTLYRRIVRTGIDMADPVLGSGVPLFTDGGHHQAGIAFGIEALRATGRSAEIEGFVQSYKGGMGHFFVIDQIWANANREPHDDTASSSMYRRRTLGPQPGGTQVTIPTQRSSTDGDWYQTAIPPGSIVTRGSDGATALTTGTHKFFPNANSGTLTLDIDAQPSPAFASGDVIHVQWPAGTWQTGDVAWGIKGAGNPNMVTPSGQNGYANLRTEGAQALWLDLCGILPASLQPVYDFAAWADRPDTPSAENDWPGQWDPVPAFGGADPQAVYRARAYPPATAAALVGPTARADSVVTDLGGGRYRLTREAGAGKGTIAAIHELPAALHDTGMFLVCQAEEYDMGAFSSCSIRRRDIAGNAIDNVVDAPRTGVNGAVLFDLKYQLFTATPFLWVAATNQNPGEGVTFSLRLHVP